MPVYVLATELAFSPEHLSHHRYTVRDVLTALPGEALFLPSPVLFSPEMENSHI